MYTYIHTALSPQLLTRVIEAERNYFSVPFTAVGSPVDQLDLDFVDNTQTPSSNLSHFNLCLRVRMKCQTSWENMSQWFVSPVMRRVWKVTKTWQERDALTTTLAAGSDVSVSVFTSPHDKGRSITFTSNWIVHASLTLSHTPLWSIQQEIIAWVDVADVLMYCSQCSVYINTNNCTWHVPRSWLITPGPSPSCTYTNAHTYILADSLLPHLIKWRKKKTPADLQVAHVCLVIQYHSYRLRKGP